MQRNLARMYLNMPKTPPDLGAVLSQSREARALLLTAALAALVMALNPQFIGLTYAIALFVSAFTARRLKSALDFQLTWPVLREAFDWEEIRRAG